MDVARAISPPSRSTIRRCTPGLGAATQGSEVVSTQARCPKSAWI
jgi:hypothetical protein